MQLTAKELEFLVALSAHEESFLYEVYADLAGRMPSSSSLELVGAALTALEALLAAGIVQLGKRNLKYEDCDVWLHQSLPDALRNFEEWAWPEESADQKLWHVFLTGRRVFGCGLDALPEERKGALMFASETRPNNSFKPTPLRGVGKAR